MHLWQQKGARRSCRHHEACRVEHGTAWGMPHAALVSLSTSGPWLSAGSDVIAQRYSGFFYAAIAGAYQFSLTSDDGSFLWLDGNPTPLIDNNLGSPGFGCGEHPAVPLVGPCVRLTVLCPAAEQPRLS